MMVCRLIVGISTSFVSAQFSDYGPSAQAQIAAGSDHCKGGAYDTVAGFLDVCEASKLRNFSGYKFFDLYTCNETTITLNTWGYKDGAVPPSNKCGGTAHPDTMMPFPRDKCFPDPMARGLFGTYSCNGTHFTVRHWQLAPPVPTLRCAAAKGVSIGMSVEVDPSAVDKISFEVGKHGRPFLGYVVPVDTSGAITAQIPGVHPSTEYTIQVRAHARGENEGNPSAWSNVSESVVCSSGQGDALETSGPTTSKAVKTRWIEVVRTVTHDGALADFLDQHNTFDMISAGTGFAMLGGRATGQPWTRYCVEVEDVELQGVVTADTSGLPKVSHFSDYDSCNSGQCVCMVSIDRSWARMPKEQINRMCHIRSNDPHPPSSPYDCSCPAAMDAQSQKYVGRAPVPIPMEVIMNLPKLPEFPASYPHPTIDSPMGYIFHFPTGGRCKDGAKVGDDGCTWQLAPLTHTISTHDVIALGANLSTMVDQATQTIRISSEVALYNIQVFQKAFDNLPVDLPKCGSGSELGGSSVSMFV